MSSKPSLNCDTAQFSVLLKEYVIRLYVALGATMNRNDEHLKCGYLKVKYSINGRQRRA